MVLAHMSSSILILTEKGEKKVIKSCKVDKLDQSIFLVSIPVLFCYQRIASEIKIK